MTKILFILNDPPYGTERSYNALRLALNLLKQEPRPEVSMFLVGDGASCAKAGQVTPEGYYNIERMLKGVAARGGVVGVCGTCMDARGLKDGDLAAAARRSSLDELTAWTLWADKVLVF
ncbi:MAG TPA: DsrE family protein [Candidatus Thermoplasmatota archaeon]|nr:DsrE family protein [Candidatus Thermoplasmatota archaeon]